MKTGDIILYKNEHESFSWSNGLFIILNHDKKLHVLSMCRLDKEGNPKLFDDGRFMETSTSSNKNPYITITNLRYKLPKNYKYA